MTERDRFEYAWREEYPLHESTIFRRSGLNPDAYVNTRVQDGWLMWQSCSAAHSAGAQAQPMTDAARDVLAERQRQVNVEGWTTKHDDLHTDFGAAKAAAVYALHAADTVGVYSHFWPWEPHWWKPSTPRRDLVKAGALVLAEIERLDRAKGE